MGAPEFRKYHGLGNDYIVVDPSESAWTPSAEAVKAMCDRNYGPGADGIVFGPLAGDAGVDLRIFNPDGSEAEKSGNGIRIFAWRLHEAGLLPAAGKSLRTKGGPVYARAVSPGAAPGEPGWGVVEVDMGRPDFSAARLGLRTDAPELVGAELAFGGRLLTVTCVSMGNPHCVVMLPGADAAAAKELGPLLENDPLFPERTNVQFLEVEARDRIRVEIWERGAGYTLASGSSSCAAAAAARRLGLVGDEAAVSMPGGNLSVSFRDGSAFLTGPVEPVFEGRFLPPLRGRIGLD